MEESISALKLTFYTNLRKHPQVIQYDAEKSVKEYISLLNAYVDESNIVNYTFYKNKKKELAKINSDLVDLGSVSYESHKENCQISPFDDGNMNIYESLRKSITSTLQKMNNELLLPHYEQMMKPISLDFMDSCNIALIQGISKKRSGIWHDLTSLFYNSMKIDYDIFEKRYNECKKNNTIDITVYDQKTIETIVALNKELPFHQKLEYIDLLEKKATNLLERESNLLTLSNRKTMMINNKIYNRKNFFEMVKDKMTDLNGTWQGDYLTISNINNISSDFIIQSKINKLHFLQLKSFILACYGTNNPYEVAEKEHDAYLAILNRKFV
jgi:hypothetical protein